MFNLSKDFFTVCYLTFDTGRSKKNDDVVYATPHDLWNQVPLTLAFLCLRYVLNKYVFVPFAKWLKINDDVERKPVPHNETLEDAYMQSAKRKDLSSLAKKMDLTEQQVEEWWRLRRTLDKPSTLVKFTENMWRGLFSFCNIFFGLYTLWDKEWLWNMDEIKNVHSSITNDVWWFYMVSSAYYWSLTITQFTDVRRKDFWQTFVHHVITNVLMTISWILNFYRVGTVVLLLHDPSEVMLELTKCTRILRGRAVTFFFSLFAITWVLLRLMLFPYWVLTRTAVQAYVCNTLIVHSLNGMLWILLALHLHWTRLIWQVASKVVTEGEEPEDIRSSDSESEH